MDSSENQNLERECEEIFETDIASLNPSAEKFQFLKALHLIDSRAFTELPEDIGILINLEVLNISDAFRISYLPSSIGKLKNHGCFENLSRLVTHCRSLIKIKEDFLEPEERNKIGLALNFNRAIAKIGNVRPDQWPLVLNNANRAFDQKDRNHLLIASRIQQLDAIYRLLTDSTGSFATMLEDRGANRKKSPRRAKRGRL